MVVYLHEGKLPFFCIISPDAVACTIMQRYEFPETDPTDLQMVVVMDQQLADMEYLVQLRIAEEVQGKKGYDQDFFQW